MIVKILGSSSADFNGVKYNDKKIENGTGELMLMKNFPSFINEKSNQEVVKNYFRSISKNEKVRKPQFHAVISTRFREHSKEELAEISENFMDEMSYGKQAFIVVFHNDTENNHIHIVSTRVDKASGKKINDSFEKLKSQKALSNVMQKLYGENLEGQLNKLLDYKISSLKQLETLLERSGFKLIQNKKDEKTLDILKNGVKIKSINGNQIVFDSQKNDIRLRQIRAILIKYREIHSNKVFKVEDNRSQTLFKKVKNENFENKINPKIEYESELQKKLREIFGIDIVFHQKEDFEPFGYTLIDHKTGKVYKGSEILKMNELFEFTSGKIDKRTFEILKDYNIQNEESKKVLMDFFKQNQPEIEIKDFMLFDNRKKKDFETFKTVREDLRNQIRNQKPNDEIFIIKTEEGKHFGIHSGLHYIGELRVLIGEDDYQKFLNPEIQNENRTKNNEKSEVDKAVDELLFELMRRSGTAIDPAENELKKRRKKRK